MSCITSQVTLGGVTFDLDPDEYIPLDGVRRGSVHRLIDGTRIVQDRGYTLTGDGTLILRGRFTTLVTLNAILALYTAAAGTSYTLTDFKDNQFTVIFAPGKSMTLTPITGSNAGWQYQIDLIVTAVTKLLGTTL